AYTKYAFEGVNVNDQNIIIRDKVPESFKLAYIFKASGKYIGVFRAEWYVVDEEINYYCKFLKPELISKRRDIICFDFEELVERTVMLSPEDRFKFAKIKTAMRKRLIAFESIECYYLIEEIYFNL
ncbi:hypothetical protein IKJ53_04655, partial [bacterium]|nr:hypothetical protein [bacterium]